MGVVIKGVGVGCAGGRGWLLKGLGEVVAWVVIKGVGVGCEGMRRLW